MSDHSTHVEAERSAGTTPSTVTQPEDEYRTFIRALATQRQVVTRHARAAVSAEEPSAEQTNGAPAISALLVSSLEELKVAEEEILCQHDEITASAVAIERQLAHYRQLFELAPVALVVTDLAGAIRQVNGAAARLFRRDPQHLERKPLAALVPRGERALFRDGLSNLSLTVGATDWEFTLERTTDVPIRVSADVHVVPGATGGSVFHWALRPCARSVRE
jgi:PAS domain-containing protein